MQTTITIDDQLIEQATRLADTQDQSLVITIALKEFIQRHQAQPKRNLMDLYGFGGIRDDYDYKALRNEDGKECI
ncbi:type II toxin-antitoxin system VapB family antitoxin [Methylosarcina fibrata]|uniref:type II toxin-antitoxin system VapB family antitoxin n=1 Tax=Methylosarcina fibrata TaxID=105972 RepID=UPI0003754276|nr:type II toxin-antitoxin system VapB family antitoxin [Methylosarcina fibrata]